MAVTSKSAEADRMTSTQNKQLVEEFSNALFTNGDPTAVDRYLDPEFINYDPPLPGSPGGPEGMRQAAELFRRAFPDWRSDVQHMIAEDDLLVEHFIAHGTHRGSVMGEMPTDSTSCCMASTSSGSSTARSSNAGDASTILDSCGSSGLRHNKPRLHRMPDQTERQ